MEASVSSVDDGSGGRVVARQLAAAWAAAYVRGVPITGPGGLQRLVSRWIPATAVVPGLAAMVLEVLVAVPEQGATAALPAITGAHLSLEREMRANKELVLPLLNQLLAHGTANLKVRALAALRGWIENVDLTDVSLDDLAGLIEPLLSLAAEADADISKGALESLGLVCAHQEVLQESARFSWAASLGLRLVAQDRGEAHRAAVRTMLADLASDNIDKIRSEAAKDTAVSGLMGFLATAVQMPGCKRVREDALSLVEGTEDAIHQDTDPVVSFWGKFCLEGLISAPEAERGRDREFWGPLLLSILPGTNSCAD